MSDRRCFVSGIRITTSEQHSEFEVTLTAIPHMVRECSMRPRASDIPADIRKAFFAWLTEDEL